jgi:ABC-2 type transport system ATP-binding protein
MNMDTEVAIAVEHVSKDFVLPHEKVTSIKSAFTGIYKQKNKSREVQHALKDISFSVKKGEFFGIVGRNGSGKSTMLKILANIYQPTKGTIATHGKLVPFIELGVGFNPELSGRANVYLNGAMLGFSRKEIDAMYNDIVSFAELERFMDQKLKNYSSGMQVRLAFSMATRSEADILLVDEVLAVGDADFQRKCFSYFRTLKRNKKTVVFVSHDMSSVRQYCDRAILIENSQLIKAGTADEVATEYSRMFSAEHTDIASQDDGGKRWGNGRAKIKKVITLPEQIDASNPTMTVRATIEVTEKMSNLILGFVIKGATGDEVTGTNTKLQKVVTGDWVPGQKRTVQWELPNIFSDGEYVVDIAVIEEDGLTVCDWWESARKFSSFEEIPSPYLVHPAIQTEFK